MAPCFRYVRVFVVLVCILPLSCGLGFAATIGRQVTEQALWTCVDFSLSPRLAVFRSRSGEYVVAPGHVLPGSEARLEELSEAGATLSVVSTDGRPLRLQVSRGESIDLQQILGALSESRDSIPPSAAVDGESIDAQ